MPQLQLNAITSPNLLTNVTLQAGGTSSSSTSFTVNFTPYLEGVIQFTILAGNTPSRVCGCQVAAYPSIDGTNYDTQTSTVLVVPTTASATNTYSLRLTTGYYQVVVTNLDSDTSNNGGSWVQVSAVLSELVTLGN